MIKSDKMISILLLASPLIFKIGLAIPVYDDDDNQDKCFDVLAPKACEELTRYDQRFLHYYDSALANFGDRLEAGDVLQKLVALKLKFFADIGLLEQIPFVGRYIYQVVNDDPDGISEALRGGFMGAVRLVNMIKDAAKNAYKQLEDVDWGK